MKHSNQLGGVGWLTLCVATAAQTPLASSATVFFPSGSQRPPCQQISRHSAPDLILESSAKSQGPGTCGQAASNMDRAVASRTCQAHNRQSLDLPSNIRDLFAAISKRATHKDPTFLGSYITKAVVTSRT